VAWYRSYRDYHVVDTKSAGKDDVSAQPAAARISDQAVLRAMEEIPRDMFVQAADRDDAYRDSALGIACGQTISQPFVWPT